MGGDAPVGSVAPASAPSGLVNNHPVVTSVHNAMPYGGGVRRKGSGKQDMPDFWVPPPKNHKLHNVQYGKYFTNRAGYAVCLDFNDGTCQQGRGLYCPKQRGLVHSCSKCLGPHQATECTHTSVSRGRQKCQARLCRRKKRVNGALGARERKRQGWQVKRQMGLAAVL